MGAEIEAALVSDGTAAVLIQKTYRGYRARRKLADAAVMAKSVVVGWWNVVDAVVLRENTMHYYAHSKSWKAHDNWKRLKRKASKVGKGLEKDKKALKLTLQHWLEAVDARHRYGHNLRPYYLVWAELETIEPFFYWLDLGAGRQVDLAKCSRAVLQEQQITYLSPEQRRHYEVSIYCGKLFYKLTGKLVHTGSDKNDKWIFVLSPNGGFYIGQKVKGKFQHSSFLAGGATTAAGRMMVEHGVLKYIEAHSGHYRPSPENFESLVQILIASGADLHLAKMQLVSDDLVEKRKAKLLAQQVRDGIENAGAEAHVEVTVVNQKLITVDSNASNDQYLVTNLTFDTTGNQTAAPEEVESATTVLDQTNGAPTVPETHEVTTVPDRTNGAPAVPETHEVTTVPDQTNGAPTVPETHEATTVPDQIHENQPSAEVPAVVVEETIPTCKVGPKKKPVPLVLPSMGAMSAINPDLPRTPTLPTSPGFSRNASLAVLTPQERRHTLKAYGPKKNKSPLVQMTTVQ